MHGSSDIKCNRQNFLSFWAIFLPFYPPSSPKTQNVKKKKQKWKIHKEISSLKTGVPKFMIRWCTVPEVWCATDGQTDKWTDRKNDTSNELQLNTQYISWVIEINWLMQLTLAWKPDWLLFRGSSQSITTNIWPFTGHIYHVMITVTGGFSKKYFLSFPRKSFEQSWICYFGI